VAFNFAKDFHAEPPVCLSFGKGTAMVCQVYGDAANGPLAPLIKEVFNNNAKYHASRWIAAII
jgi:hypothetical protein